MAGEGVGVSERVAATTISQWAKMVSELTEQRYILLSLLKSKGRISYGNSGGEIRWPFRYKDHALSGFPDNSPIAFSRKHTLKNATLPWRGYYLEDAITLREKLEQGGKEAMIKVFSNREEVMRRAAIRQMADEWFKDGNSAANAAAETFHGIESFLASSNSSDTLENDVYSDSYAGHTTAAGGIAGSTDSRVWTPTVVNSTYGSNTWATKANELIRHMILQLSFGNSSEDNIDLILLTKTSYRDLLNLLETKERLNIKRGEGVSVAKLGFDKFVELDGVSIGWDAGVPATDDGGTAVNGYAFNTDRLKLKVMGKKGGSLFTARTTFNDNYQADHIFMHCLGNLQFESPRFFGAFKEVS